MASAGGAGWPFLVAPGRVRDHTVVVAPGPLVASGQYGGLEMVAGPGSPSAGWEQTSIRPGDGRALAVSYRTRMVTQDDVTSLRAGTRGAAVRDEHNRPLLAVVGIVSDRPLTGDVDADLDDAWTSVLPAYRRFLADELGYAVTSSAPITFVPRREGAGVARTVVRELAYAAGGPDRTLDDGPAARVSRSIPLAVVLALGAVVAGLAIAVHPWEQRSGAPTPVPSVRVSTPARPSTPSSTTTAPPRTLPTVPGVEGSIVSTGQEPTAA